MVLSFSDTFRSVSAKVIMPMTLPIETAVMILAIPPKAPKPDSSWPNSSSSFDEDLKMRTLSLTNLSDLYHTPRVPTQTAPWPEPPSPTSTTTFEFFPLLPTAIRRKIWTLALPGPRIVEAQYSSKQHEFRSQIPVQLHVNREARSVALTQYETAAASPLNDLDTVFDHHYLTYVNFRLDTFCPVFTLRLFIRGEWKTFLKTLPNREKIEKLGLPKRYFQFPMSVFIPLLLHYSSLKEVVVLADPCVDHHPRSKGRGEQGWCLDEGELLPTLEEFGERRKEEFLERYSIEFIDKIRESWRVKRGHELMFTYKKVCCGGQCWEMGNESVDQQDMKATRGRKAFRRMIEIPRRGVARIMMLAL
jgi:hypothetical protein